MIIPELPNFLTELGGADYKGLIILKLYSNEIIERKALPVALVTAFIYLTFGILLTISPDQADFVGLKNKGRLFTVLLEREYQT